MEEKELKTALKHWLICKKDYQIFKKGERYWLELLSNGNFCGRSDNIKNNVVYIPHDKFYNIFTLSIERL